LGRATTIATTLAAINSRLTVGVFVTGGPPRWFSDCRRARTAARHYRCIATAFALVSGKENSSQRVEVEESGWCEPPWVWHRKVGLGAKEIPGSSHGRRKTRVRLAVTKTLIDPSSFLAAQFSSRRKWEVAIWSYMLDTYTSSMYVHRVQTISEINSNYDWSTGMLKLQTSFWALGYWSQKPISTNLLVWVIYTIHSWCLSASLGKVDALIRNRRGGVRCVGELLSGQRWYYACITWTSLVKILYFPELPWAIINTRATTQSSNNESQTLKWCFRLLSSRGE